MCEVLIRLYVMVNVRFTEVKDMFTSDCSSFM